MTTKSKQDLATVSASPMTIIEQAVAQGAPVEQLERLLALQERWETGEARKAFNAAVTAFKRNPPTILKDHQVAFGKTKYKHAELDKIIDAITPALCEHGLSVRWEVEQADQIAVTCILCHELGHSESVTMRGPADDSGSKNRIQQVGSTVSYLQRYTVMSILGLAAKGVDDDGRGGASIAPATITDKQILEIEAFIADNEIDRDKIADVLKGRGLAGYAEIPAKSFKSFMSLLKRSVA